MYILLHQLIEKANINIKNCTCFCVSSAKDFLHCRPGRISTSLYPCLRNLSFSLAVWFLVFFFFFFFHFVLIEFRDVRDFVFLLTSEFQVLRLAASEKVMRYLLNE